MALFPAVIVTGNVMPLTEYPVPFQSAVVMVMSALLADNVPDNEELLPTLTLPKLNDDGETFSVPALLVGGGVCDCRCGPLEIP